MKRTKKGFSIIVSAFSILLILASSISATFAWFTASRKVDVLANGFEVTLPPHQEASFYYLNKNYNETLNEYSGYEVQKLSDAEKIAYTKVEDKTTQESPTSTKDIWPNHQLTYAIVFTPYKTGNYTFRLNEWDEDVSKTKIVKDKKTGLRLSYAIDMFAQIYDYDGDFSESKEFLADSTLETQFTSTPDKVADQQKDFVTCEVKDTTKTKVIFFTILFSNASSTYYEKVTTSTENDSSSSNIEYYVQNDDSSEESNCYEGLKFYVKKFELVAPQS